MDVGNQIRERRTRLGLSQDELAQKLYVSRVTVSHWETGKTLPDVQSMLLLANLFGTTIDELVRGDVDEMREIVEKNELRTKMFSVVLGTVEVVVLTALLVTAVAGRAYLEPVLRLLLAVTAVAFSLVMLAARHRGGAAEAKSAAELLGAASGEPVEAARASGAALGMRLVLQVFAGLAAALAVLVVGGILLDAKTARALLVVAIVAGALAGSFALGRFTRPAWTVVLLPAVWVTAAIALGVAAGSFGSPRDWFVLAGGAVVLLALWAVGRGKKRGSDRRGRCDR